MYLSKYTLEKHVNALTVLISGRRDRAALPSVPPFHGLSLRARARLLPSALAIVVAEDAVRQSQTRSRPSSSSFDFRRPG